MYYEEKFENGVWYSRSTPDGAWSKKMRQMSKEDEPKWSEPVESNPDNVGGDVQKALDIADARLEDVKDIDFGEVFWACGILASQLRSLTQLTKPPENVTCGDVSKVGEILDDVISYARMAVKAMPPNKAVLNMDWAHEQLKRALAQQQPVGYDVNKAFSRLTCFLVECHDPEFSPALVYSADEIGDFQTDLLTLKTAPKQQPDAELLEALKKELWKYTTKSSRAKAEWYNAAIDDCIKAIANAEQNGGCDA